MTTWSARDGQARAGVHRNKALALAKLSAMAAAGVALENADRLPIDPSIDPPI